jgi:hypothetical protein
MRAGRWGAEMRGLKHPGPPRFLQDPTVSRPSPPPPPPHTHPHPHTRAQSRWLLPVLFAHWMLVLLAAIIGLRWGAGPPAGAAPAQRAALGWRHLCCSGRQSQGRRRCRRWCCRTLSHTRTCTRDARAAFRSTTTRPPTSMSHWRESGPVLCEAAPQAGAAHPFQPSSEPENKKSCVWPPAAAPAAPSCAPAVVIASLCLVAGSSSACTCKLFRHESRFASVILRCSRLIATAIVCWWKQKAGKVADKVHVRG